PTGQHHVQLAAADGAEGVADGVTTGGAGGGDGGAGALNAVVYGQHTSGAVGHDHGDAKGAHAPQPFGRARLFLVDQGLDAANASAHEDTHALAVFVVHLKAGLPHSLLGNDGGELLVAVAATGIAAVEVLIGIKLFDLAQAGGGMLIRRNEGERSKSGLAGQDSSPALFHVMSQGRNHSCSGYDDPVVVILHTSLLHYYSQSIWPERSRPALTHQE